MSVYDPPIIGSIITAARAVAIISGLFCIGEASLERSGRFVPRRDDHGLNGLAWVALSIGFVFSGISFIFHDLVGIPASETMIGSLSVLLIWSMIGLGCVLRAASRAARPFSVFMTGSAIFATTIVTSILTGVP